MRLIKTKVLDMTTNERGVYVDFVACSNCGEIMLVNLGKEICPHCKKDGSLMWENKEQEVNYDYFEEEYKNDYMLISK